jgi:rSAM/selenodomain-associated transferase 2
MVVVGPIGNRVYFFSVVYCLAFILMLLLVRQFPKNITYPKALVIILLLGLSGRILFFFYPFNNDVYRYVWEGYIQNQGFNPYAHSPDSPALVNVAQGDLFPIWLHINQKYFAAAYPPFSMLLFRFLALINPNPVLFKIVMIGFDLGALIVLALIIKRKEMKPSRLLFYAANPLVILFIAGEGHLDAIQIFFICLAVYFMLYRSELFGFLTLGLAALTKYFSIIAIPFLITAKNWKKCVTVFIPLILYLPYLDAGSGLFRSLGAFGTSMHYNDSAFALLRYMFGDLAYLIGMLVFFICLLLIFLTVHDQLKSIYLAIGCLLLMLPTLHPWYLILITPFLVFFPSKAWLYLQAAVVFTFPVIAREYHTGVFQEIHWLKIFEYGPFLGLLIWGLLRDGFFIHDKSFSRPASISVIIPTLNESNTIVPCLTSLQNTAVVKEIIVADGGSRDATREIAMKYGARVIESQKGRGFQIKAGLEAASGDVLFVLHADCTAEKRIFSRAITALAVDPSAVGGAFGMRFDTKQLMHQLIAFLNNAKAFLTGISFGDQAQFIRREALELMGGYPSMLLMEDVEFAFKLKQCGRVVFLKNGVRVSGRRWDGGQFFQRLVVILRLFFRYLIERRLRLLEDELNGKYYRLYYAEQRAGIVKN